jgi:V/A-type H+-transporting ATPase subunit D
MALLHVNPTRMEYNKIKKRLRSSQRGHKLLKDKRDDLVRNFVVMAARNKEMRLIVEEKMAAVYEGFSVAEALMSPTALEEALMLPKRSVSMNVDTQNLMGVEIPVFKFNVEGASDICPYGYYGTSGELDDSIKELSEVLPYLLELSQIEKSLQLLAQEIEKTRQNLPLFLSADDMINFRIEAHGIKGALANVGAIKLSEKARELEMASAGQDYDYCAMNLPFFLEKLIVFNQQLSEAFALR